jgi:hypothetical protein
METELLCTTLKSTYKAHGADEHLSRWSTAAAEQPGCGGTTIQPKEALTEREYGRTLQFAWAREISCPWACERPLAVAFYFVFAQTSTFKQRCTCTLLVYPAGPSFGPVHKPGFRDLPLAI